MRPYLPVVYDIYYICIQNYSFILENNKHINILFIYNILLTEIKMLEIYFKINSLSHTCFS
jgi:hypothetical protein